MTSSQAITRLLGVLAARPIYGCQSNDEQIHRDFTQSRYALTHDDAPAYAGNTHLTWEQGWGVSASLRVAINREKRVHKRDGTHYYLSVSCEISWSSTGHDVSRALAAITLYRQVTELAALLEATVSGEREEPEATTPTTP